MSIFNLGDLSKIEKDKINVDLAASGIAYKEKHGMEYDILRTELEQPEELREYFRKRLEYYRSIK